MHSLFRSRSLARAWMWCKMWTVNNRMHSTIFSFHFDSIKPFISSIPFDFLVRDGFKNSNDFDMPLLSRNRIESVPELDSCKLL